MELEERTCENIKCRITWKCLPSSTQKACSKACECDILGIKGTAKTIVLGKNQLRPPRQFASRKESGSPVPGELPKAQKENDSRKIKEKEVLSSSKKESEGIRMSNDVILTIKNAGEPGKDVTMKEISNDLISEERIGRTETEWPLMKNSAPTTQPSESKTSPKSSSEDESEIQPSASTQLSSLLKEESYSSMELLNNSAKRLYIYAETLAKPRRVDEENGEILIAPAVHNIMEATKCLDVLRTVMKEKLSYLRFSKELLNEKNK